MAQKEPLDRLIQHVRRRLFLRVLVANALRYGAVAFLAVALWFILQPILLAGAGPMWKWGMAGALLSAGVVAAVAVALQRAPSRITAALAVDDAFHLQERVTTVLSLPAEVLASPAGQALTADVHQQIAALKPAGEFPLHISWSAALLPVCACLLAVVAFFFEPSWMSPGTRAGSSIPAATAKELENQFDNLKNVAFAKREDKFDKSDELKELEKAWDKLVKQPAPKTEEQIRERVKEMRSLEDKMKDRIRDLASKNDALKKELDKLNSDPKKDGSKEIKELTEALAKKQMDQAMAALDRLAKKLQDKNLSKEERQKLAEQLQELQDKLQRLAEKRDQKDKLQREFDEGKISKEQLEREMERLGEQAKNLKELQDLAELLGECSACLGKGGDADLLRKMELIKGKLKAIELTEDELRALMEDQDRLDELNDALLLALNQGNADFDGDGPGNGLGKGRRPGTRRLVGPEPKGSKIVNARQQAESDPNGQQRITGFTKGGLFSRIPAREVGGAFKQAVQDAPEAIERQRIPPDAADMAKGYFQKLGGQK